MTPSTHRLPRWSLVTLALLMLLGLAPARPSAAQGAPAQCSSGYALWANGQGRDETLDISGSSLTINGRVRSNADLRISGSSSQISSAVEYVTTFEDSGDSNRYPTPTRVAAALPPLSYSLATYATGGAAATAAQAAGRYRLISGDFEVSEPTTLDGLYYVTGDAKLSASDIRGSFTIVAAGTIDVSGSNLRATPYVSGLLLFAGKREVGAAVIKLAGSDSELRGAIYGPGGTVELSGSNNRIDGIVLGEALKLNGSSLRISFDQSVCGGEPPVEEEQPPAEPPAEIRIDDGAITRRVEIINNITFVTIQITIKNNGGRAKGTRLLIDLGDDDDDDDDDRFELSEVRFSDGAGYVIERIGGRLVLGVGQYNVVHRNSPVVVNLTYRLRDGVRGDDDDDDDEGRINFRVRGRLQFSDADGSRLLVLPVLLIVVPVPVIVVSPPPPVEVVRLPLERIDLRFRTIWESRGGLAIFGLPLTEARTLGNGTIIQYFERARLELRPGGLGVQSGLLAVELGYSRPPSVRLEDLDDDERRWYVPATGHLVGTPFRTLWARPGALLIFGLPISALDLDDDGREIQCFERVCMQRFPELSGTPSEVQLRLLGVELLARGDDDD